MTDPVLGAGLITAIGTLGGVAITGAITIWVTSDSRRSERELAAERKQQAARDRVHADRYAAYPAWSRAVRSLLEDIPRGVVDPEAIKVIYHAADEVDLVGSRDVRDAVALELEAIQGFRDKPSERSQHTETIRRLHTATMKSMRGDMARLGDETLT